MASDHATVFNNILSHSRSIELEALFLQCDAFFHHWGPTACPRISAMTGTDSLQATT